MSLDIWGDFKKAARKLWDAVNDGKKQLRGVVNSGVHSVEGAVNSGKRAVEDVAAKGKHEVEGAVNGAKREIQGELEQARHELQGIKNEVEQGVEQLPELAEKAVEEALQKIAAALSGQVLKKARDEVKAWRAHMSELAEQDPELVDAIDQLGFTVGLSIVKLQYAGFYTRSEQVAEVLDTLASKPPEVRRRPIIEAIEGLGPSTVNLGLSAEFALGVGTNALGGSFEFDSIPLKLFTRLADRQLARLGVPA